jgi:hypothetical protein
VKHTITHDPQIVPIGVILIEVLIELFGPERTSEILDEIAGDGYKAESC